MAETEALGVQFQDLKERVDREGQINTKEHDEINKRLDKVLEEALKRWPAGVGITISILSAICGALATWTFTHLPR